MRCKNTKLLAGVMGSVFYGSYLHICFAAVQPLLRTMAPKMSKQRRVPLGAREVTVIRRRKTVVKRPDTKDHACRLLCDRYETIYETIMRQL